MTEVVDRVFSGVPRKIPRVSSGLGRSFPRSRESGAQESFIDWWLCIFGARLVEFVQEALFAETAGVDKRANRFLSRQRGDKFLSMIHFLFRSA